jgi:hypothetical protein
MFGRVGLQRCGGVQQPQVASLIPAGASSGAQFERGASMEFQALAIGLVASLAAAASAALATGNDVVIGDIDDLSGPTCSHLPR